MTSFALRIGTSRRCYGVLWIIAGLLAVRLGLHSIRSISEPSSGFVTYYAAARLLREGTDVTHFYDDEWFRAQVVRFEPRVQDIFWANPPTMSLIMLPLTGIDYGPARTVWIIGTLLLILSISLGLPRLLRFEGPLARVFPPTFVCFTCSYQPVYENIAQAQTYVVLLAGLALAWIGYRKATSGLLGIPLGVAFATKTAALPMWPLLVITRRWRAILWGASVALVLVLASWPAIGADAWSRYLQVARDLTSQPLLAVTAYQTLLSFGRHLFGPGGNAIGAPLIELPLLAGLLSPTLSLALLGISLAAAVRAPAKDSTFAALALLGLPTSPVSLDYHYVMALLPIGLLGAEISRSRLGSLLWTPFLAGSLMIGLDLPYRSALFMNGVGAILAYPKLYGVLLLWGIAVRLAIGKDSPTEVAPSEPGTETAAV